MMAEVARLAEADAGAPVLPAVDSVRVVELVSWRYPDPGAAVASQLGISPRHTMATTIGGNSPQLLVNHTALAIQRGELDVALLAGGEALSTRLRARKEGVRLAWSNTDDGAAPDDVLGDARPGTNEAEMAAGLMMPVQVYPMFENALRAAAGESIDAHQVKIAELWARFSEVAASNPYAWNPGPYSADESRTVTPENRIIGFPYTKLMNSIIEVDQAAAVLVCSVEAAERLGVPQDRWVFPHAGTGASDHYFLSERADLRSSPAIRIAGRRALELAEVPADELTHVDIYSCFPSAVQIAATELGLPLDRPLTVTGGLTFAGGPANNYVLHSIATMVERLRDDPGASGLCTGLGWYVTKHAFGVYSTRPPDDGFRHDHTQPAVDALPRREAAVGHEGPVTVETYTVMHERDGSPSNAIAACLLDDGRRAWATTTDHDALALLEAEEGCGRAATISGAGELRL